VKTAITPGTTSKIVPVYITKLSDGSALTGVLYSDITGYYCIEGATPVAITLATMTPGTWATGGFIERSSTNMPGHYELGLPNAAIVAGTKSVVIQLKANGGTSAGMANCNAEIQLDTSVIVQNYIHKNTAYPAFPFDMVLSSDHVTPYAGLANTITSKVALGSGNFVACTNSGAAVAKTGGPAGKFHQDLSAADLNGNGVTLVFSAPTCDDTIVYFATQS